jgi:cellulose synthase/poly-beta-1,6-N-acetylglucosamine synthase-like glycosyltransferase
LVVEIVTFILFFVWAFAMLLAVWAERIAHVFAVKIPLIAKRPMEPYTPRVAVILPIKGVDDDTADNIQALLQQDYPNYRLLFAVESANDPIVATLEQVAAEDGRGRIEIVVAGLADSRGQKVHNQLAAVERTNQRDEILVFMDADARPNPNWLRSLVNPLQWHHVGATTGFRFYIPVQPHTANAMVSVINASVAALLGPERRNFCWGGSMAVRRKDFLQHVKEDWENALSDDYVMSWCVKHKMKSVIKFVPSCIVASTANFTWGSFFEFACRQYRITKVCALHVWLTAVGGAAIYLFSLAYTLWRFVHVSIASGTVLPWQHGGDMWLLPMFVALYAWSVMRGKNLLLGGETMLPEHATALKKIRFWYMWGYPFVVLVNFVALIGSAFGRDIIWRGVSYTMVSRTKTLVHRPEIQKLPPSENAAGNAGTVEPARERQPAEQR